MSRFDPALIERALAYVKPPERDTTFDYDEAVRLTFNLCVEFEGFESRPYLCPAGKPTIGFGATFYLDGRLVSLKDPAISRETAERLLVMMITKIYMPQTVALIKVPASTGLVAALTDFSFNLGPPRLKNSTLIRKVNAQDWAAVPIELRKWIYAAGQAQRGLVRRREAEISLI